MACASAFGALFTAAFATGVFAFAVGVFVAASVFVAGVFAAGVFADGVLASAVIAKNIDIADNNSKLVLGSVFTCTPPDYLLRSLAGLAGSPELIFLRVTLHHCWVFGLARCGESAIKPEPSLTHEYLLLTLVQLKSFEPNA
jgi:hypothetical protein